MKAISGWMQNPSMVREQFFWFLLEGLPQKEFLQFQLSILAIGQDIKTSPISNAYLRLSIWLWKGSMIVEPDLGVLMK